MKNAAVIICFAFVGSYAQNATQKQADHTVAAERSLPNAEFGSVEKAKVIDSKASAAAAAANKRDQEAIAAKFSRMQQSLNDEEIGQNSPDKKDASKPIHPLLLGLEVLFALAGVLVLAVITVRLLKRAQKGLLGSGSATVAGELLEVVETLHLAPGIKLIAVRIYDKVAIMSVSKENATLAHLLEDPAVEVLANKTSNPKAFSDNLNRLLDKFKKPRKVSEMLEEA